MKKTNEPYYAIITSYHFNPTKKENYTRLLKTISTSCDQLKNRGSLVLVANGTGENASLVSCVLEDVNANKEIIDPVELTKNRGNTGGLNAGIDYIYKNYSQHDNLWVCPVQSSAILGDTWIDNIDAVIRKSVDHIDGIFGTLVYEHDADCIWTAGHCIKDGLVKNVAYKQSHKSFIPQETCHFPCLSACAFPFSLVKKIVDTYGNFVCENLPHYGDCADVAIRASAVLGDHVNFKHCAEAIGTKRAPEGDERIQIYQLMSSRMYYKGSESDEYFNRALNQVKNNHSDRFKVILSKAEHGISMNYSPNCICSPQIAHSLRCETKTK